MQQVYNYEYVQMWGTFYVGLLNSICILSNNKKPIFNGVLFINSDIEIVVANWFMYKCIMYKISAYVLFYP